MEMEIKIINSNVSQCCVSNGGIMSVRGGIKPRVFSPVGLLIKGKFGKWRRAHFSVRISPVPKDMVHLYWVRENITG